jgi:hypothetical protein
MNTDLETNDLKRIENRLRTFDNWPVNFIDKYELARAGLLEIGINFFIHYYFLFP